jgi:hypothetical protein
VFQLESKARIIELLLPCLKLLQSQIRRQPYVCLDYVLAVGVGRGLIPITDTLDASFKGSLHG